jgi:hypothetical protein
VNALTAARAGVGAALLLRPVGHDRGARVYARALGARHLVEAVLLGPVPPSTALRIGAAVDGLHAASVVPLVLRPGQRRLAALNLAGAVGFTLAGLAAASDSDHRR